MSATDRVTTDVSGSTTDDGIPQWLVLGPSIAPACADKQHQHRRGLRRAHESQMGMVLPFSALKSAELCPFPASRPSASSGMMVMSLGCLATHP
jgi:hypothetical protein